ncbi:hypothetical protein [Streptomyces sp. PvR034]|uniref:hypothetical protein n=1 Tax=Streptomyces sp. PvR034 TaxID=3156401 RepID=UPI003396CC59
MRKGSLTLLAVCVTAATLTGCGGPPRDGYVAVGAAAPGSERGAGETVAPKGAVEYQPLAGPAGASAPPSSTSPPAPGNPPTAGSGAGGAVPGAPTGSASAPGSTAAGGPGDTPGTTAPPPAAGTSGGSGTSGGPGGSGTSGGSAGSGGSTTPPPPKPPAATPARIQLGAPARSAAADRWCERVGVTFTNTGTTAARSGTVTFSTHIIGALGIDWATITSTQPLPAPIAGGAAKTQTYTVCVESWRVPLGMHIETQRVTATWS